MAGHETADIVFCIDASGSMASAFKGVKNHIVTLLKTLDVSGLQTKWDVRFDFLAYRNLEDIMWIESMNKVGKDCLNAIYGSNSPNGSSSSSGFFTRDINTFKDRLDIIECVADEASLFALDIAADFPFRPSNACHRVVVFLTDEPIDAGVNVEDGKNKLMELANKYQDKRIMLFMVTPDCSTFDTLSQIDRCEWTIDSSDGLTGIDFNKLMESIGKSVSVSQSVGIGLNEAKPLYNETNWTVLGDDERWCDCLKDGLNIYV